jgi:beta-lactamase superfamily II metal-dependent hydrolase
MNQRLNFAGLPTPESGRITLYVLGPGVGESQVLALPDGSWIVIDSCEIGGRCAPLELLQHFGAQEIGLLVLTHSDLDHVAGIDQLVTKVSVKECWRYPGAGTLADLTAQLLNLYPDDKRAQKLRSALQAIEDLAESDVPVFDAGISLRTLAIGECEIESIAPTAKDVASQRKGLRSAFSVTAGKAQLSPQIQDYLLGKTARITPNANILSAAIAVSWRQWKLLFAGDVENSSDQSRGWPGVITHLRANNRLRVLQTVSVVKVAHHGSQNAFSQDAWTLHSTGGAVKLAIVTPKNGGQNSPPQAPVIRAIAAHATRLGLTAKGRFNVSRAMGWEPNTTQALPGTPGCIAAVLPSKGPIRVSVGGGSRLYRRET